MLFRSGLFGQIAYSFINDLGKTQFRINPEGLITTAQKLDRENPLNKDVVLTVMALDGGGKLTATEGRRRMSASTFGVNERQIRWIHVQ